MNKYNNFWRRCLASLIDELALASLYYLILTFKNDHTPLSFFVFAIVYIVGYSTYYIVCHGKYGKTLGKWLVNIRVTKLDEVSSIGYFNAFKRDALWFSADIIILVFFTIRLSQSIAPVEETLSTYDDYITVVAVIWILLEMITMLFNSKQRSLNDYLGSSVVVKTKF